MAKFEFTFPFEPPWDDCVLSGETKSGAKFYVFNSLYKDQTEEEKAWHQKNISRAATKIYINKHLREMEAAKTTEATCAACTAEDCGTSLGA